MLLKWIRCTIPDDKRGAFSTAQEQWSTIADTDGFYAQVGGWNKDQPGQACIVGFWRDQAAYQHFMDAVHDQVMDKSNQGLTYTDCQVGLYDALFEIRQPNETYAQVLDRATLITVFRWLIEPQDIAEFEQFLHKHWRPILEESGSVLAAVVARQSEQSDYLVALIWREEQDFVHFSTYRSGALLQQTQLFAHGSVYAFSLFPGWQVLGA